MFYGFTEDYNSTCTSLITTMLINVCVRLCVCMYGCRWFWCKSKLFKDPTPGRYLWGYLLGLLAELGEVDFGLRESRTETVTILIPTYTPPPPQVTYISLLLSGFLICKQNSSSKYYMNIPIYGCVWFVVCDTDAYCILGLCHKLQTVINLLYLMQVVIWQSR